MNIHICASTFGIEWIYVCIHTYIHTYMYTSMDTSIHTYIKYKCADEKWEGQRERLEAHRVCVGGMYMLTQQFQNSTIHVFILPYTFLHLYTCGTYSLSMGHSRSSSSVRGKFGSCFNPVYWQIFSSQSLSLPLMLSFTLSANYSESLSLFFFFFWSLVNITTLSAVDVTLSFSSSHFRPTLNTLIFTQSICPVNFTNLKIKYSFSFLIMICKLYTYNIIFWINNYDLQYIYV